MSVVDKISLGGTSYDVQDSAAVHFTEAQTLTDTEKRQARINASATATAVIDGFFANSGQHPATAKEIYSGAAKNVDVFGTGLSLSLNGTASTGVIMSLLGNRVLGNGGSTVPSESQLAEGPFNVIQGHQYALRLKLTQGTVTGNNPYIALFDTTGTAISGFSCNMSQGETIITMDRSQIGQLCFFFFKNSVHTNAVYAIEFVDITSGDNGIEIPVSGATPTITAIPGAAYNCIGTGTVASPVAVTELDFTPSASGICSVRFVSGTTATVLTLPSSVKMPDWWTGTEANRTYEISIADGVYGVVTSWA